MVYKKKGFKWWDWVIIYILFAYGAIYFFLPHRLHIAGWALDWRFFEVGLPHWAHVLIGGTFIIGGIFYIILRRKSLKRR